MDDENKSEAEQLVEEEQNKKQKQQDSAAVSMAKSKAKSAAKGAIEKKVGAKGFTAIIKFLCTPPILYVLIVVLIIFLAIGLISFLTSMPAIMKSTIADYGKKIWDFVSISGDQAENHVAEQNILDLAEYLYEKGYDLEGFGFVPSGSIAKTTEGNLTFDLDGDGKSDVDYKNTLLYTYLVAAERTYMVDKNSNLFKQSFKMGIRNALGAVPITSLPLFITSLFGKDYNGMVYIDYGIRTANMSLEIDRVNEKVIVTTDKLIESDVMTFDLDGWLGQYGKPVEFLLALHLSTMAPDFVYDFCTDKDLQTKVTVGLDKKTEVDLKYTYHLKHSDGTVEECDIDRVKEVYDELQNTVGKTETGSGTIENTSRILKRMDCLLKTGGVYTTSGDYAYELYPFTSGQLIDEKGNYNDNITINFDTSTKEPKTVTLGNFNANSNNIFDYEYAENGVKYYILPSINDIIKLYKNSNNPLSKGGQDADKIVQIWLKGYNGNIAGGDTVIQRLDKFLNTNKAEGDTIEYNFYDRFIDIANNQRFEQLETLSNDLNSAYNKAVQIYEATLEEEKINNSEYDVTFEEIEKAYEQMQDENVDTALPYVKKVENHWYMDYDLDYKGAYQKVDEYNLPDSIINIELEDDEPTGFITVSAKANGAWVQVLPAKQIENSAGRSKMEKLLVNGMYYIYDGTKITASQIEEAKEMEENGEITKYKMDENGNTNADKINKELQEKGLDVRREKIDFNLKNTMTAFTMLEAVGTEDSETIYRNFKNLIASLGYFTIDEIEEADNPLDWLIPDYSPVEWPLLADYVDIIDFGRKIYSKATIDKINSENSLEENNNSEADPQGENNSAQNTNNSSEITSLDNFLFIGDSRYDANNTINKEFINGLGNNISNTGVGSAQILEWATVAKNGGVGTVQKRSVDITGNYSGICIQLGVNGVYDIGPDKSADNMELLIQGLRNIHGNIPIFINSCIQVNSNSSSANYKWDYNKMKNYIDEYNKLLKEYCGNTTNVYYVETSNGLLDSNGFVKLEYESDGLHLNKEGMKIFTQNLKNGIVNLNASSNSYQKTQELGFEPGLNVIIPGQAEILEIGKEDDVQYIEIKFIDSELVVENMTMRISGFQLLDEIKKGDIIEKGETIGTTLDTDILMIFKNNRNAIINNIEDYMKVPIAQKSSSNGASGDLEDIALMILEWEGGFGSAYTSEDHKMWKVIPDKAGWMANTAGGSGITNWCKEQFFATGHGDLYPLELGQWVPVDAILEVKAVVINDSYKEIEGLLNKYGITDWQEYQKHAFLSLYYNGFHGKCNQILQAWASGNKEQFKNIWLSCVTSGYESGHRKRRAVELDLFENGGNYEITEERKNECVNKYYGR